MRTEGNYILGTPSEIAEYLLRDIIKGNNADKNITSDSKFYNCDFTVVDFIINGYSEPDEAEKLSGFSLKEIYDASEYLYGIKKINTGFDSNWLDLFADYYSGGSGVYNCLYPWDKNENCISTVERMITGTISICRDCSDNTILIGEILN